MSSLIIQDIKVKDIEKRRLPSKHYAYIIEVHWSNGIKAMIGRQYSAFFDFQMALLELFPEEAGQRDPRKRQIPFLPGKILFRRSNTREVALKRMRPIAEYCTGISKLPKYISESEIVVNFFTQNTEDKALTKDASITLEEQQGKKSANEITGPVTFDKYIAIAEYKKENKKELNLKEGEVVEVIEKHENGWWLAANEEGTGGWVPGVYLESLYGETPLKSSNRLKPGSGEMYEAITDFKASSSDEMGFNCNDVIEILEKNLEGWWYARRDDAEGWVPATYLEKSNAMSTTRAQTSRVRPGFDAKAKWRKSIENAKKPPPKRQTVRRTLTKDAAAKAQVNFTAKMIKQESLDEYDNEEEFAGIYETIASFDSTIPDGISFEKDQTVYVTQKSSAGWWYGRIGNKRGWVPESYLTAKPQNISSSKPPKSPKSPKPQRPPVPKIGNGLNNGSNPSSPRFSPKPANKITGFSKFKLEDVVSDVISKTDQKRKDAPLPLTPTSPGKSPLKGQKKINLIDCQWYRDISRREAEDALVCEKEEGYFIVRPSKRGANQGKPYSLTLFHHGTVWNFHIRLRADKKYAVGVYKDMEPCFTELPDLVEYYKQNPMLIGEEERKVKLVDSPQELYARC